MKGPPGVPDAFHHELTISNPQKVYFPSGLTKADMIRYYVGISPFLLPHLNDRPVTVIRFPDGVKGEQFYEKNVPGHAPNWIKTYAVARRHHEGEINYILVQDVETLAWCANLGAIEFHPFLHRVPQLDQPTHVAFDLDPGEGADIFTCIEVARLLRELFERLNLKAYPKVSGSKGIQIYVPLNTSVTYDATTPFAKTVAELLAKEHPDLIVSEMPKALRKKKVLIDWSQNSEAKTTVCVYSMRGKHDEPFISVPVEWRELEAAAKTGNRDSLFFTPDAAIRRAEKKGDLFAPILKEKQRLPDVFLKLSPKKTRAGSLQAYANKRDFNKTHEPGADLPARSQQGSRRRFVIQKHAASHLHFDFRIEIGDTLKSWAVPKGLPYELDVRRSAFQVEDHPIEYLDFEGTIPQGQYGGGTVMVWDIGTYELIDGNWYKGDLKLWLEGKKLKGEWHLFRIKSDENKPVWLIIKSGMPMKPLSAKLEDSSVLTKRTMERIAADNDAQWQSNRDVEKKPVKSDSLRTAKGGKGKFSKPEFVEPMKPLLVGALPEGDQWRYEVKWDGFRALILKHGSEVRLLSRNNKSLSSDFPQVVAAAKMIKSDTCIVDGEIVALDGAGRPSFQSLQNRVSTDATIVFYAFDLLSRDGEDLRKEPLVQRQAALEKIVTGTEIRISSSLDGDAQSVIAAVTQLGLEGVVAKRSDSIYHSGDRTAAWQKLRLRVGQEFVIGGYRPGMKPFESILVGYYEGSKLMFAGKVRPGFTAHSRAIVWNMIKGDEIEDCPFSNLPDADKKGRWGEGITPEEMKTLRWVKPHHVVEIQFVEWTRNGHLRHAAYTGLRKDKDPKDVRRETNTFNDEGNERVGSS